MLKYEIRKVEELNYAGDTIESYYVVAQALYIYGIYIITLDRDPSKFKTPEEARHLAVSRTEETIQLPEISKKEPAGEIISDVLDIMNKNLKEDSSTESLKGRVVSAGQIMRYIKENFNLKSK